MSAPVGTASLTTAGTTTVPGATIVAGFDPAAAPQGSYVDCQAGNDGNDGTASRPWRSLQRVQQGGLTGSALFLRRGCSWSGGLRVSTGGALTIAGYDTGTQPVITAEGLDRNRGVLEINSSSITIRDLHLAHAAGMGAIISADHATLDTVEIEDVGIGVRITAPFATVTNAAIHDLHMFNNTPGGDDDSGAVGFDIEADDVTVSQTSCTHCRAPSYDYGFDGGFADIFNHGNRLKLINNTANDVQGFLEIGGVVANISAYDVVVRGNQVTDTHGAIWVHGNGTFAIATGNITVDGNTFASTDPQVLLGGNLSSLVLGSNVFTTVGRVS